MVTFLVGLLARFRMPGDVLPMNVYSRSGGSKPVILNVDKSSVVVFSSSITRLIISMFSVDAVCG